MNGLALRRAAVSLGLMTACDALIVSGLPVVSYIAGLGFLFLLPGYLLISALRLVVHNFWERLLHTVGLSIAFVLVGGLLTNTLQPLLGVTEPLRLGPVLVVLNLLMLAVLMWSVLGRRPMPKPRPFTLNKRLTAACLVPLLFPIIAVLGANTLNNGGSNWLVLVLVGGIVAYVTALFCRRDRIPESVWMSSIYGIGLALLLMTSLRAWHITGYDIAQEFQVFMLTKEHLYWSMGNLQDAYNACLSITILPTIISQFIPIADEYIYKFIAQLLFALMPVGLYLLVRRFAGKRAAWLAAFFFLSQVWFFQGMPALVRQEFAMLFFVLLLLVLFNESLSRAVRYPLIVGFSVGMVLSHYSTSYIAFLLLAAVYGVSALVRLVNRVRTPGRKWLITHAITLPALLIMLGGLVLWNVGATRTAGNIAAFIDHSSSNISQLMSANAITNAAKQLLYPTQENHNLQAYVAERTHQFRKEWPMLRYYSDAQIATSSPLREAELTAAPPQFGKAVETAAAWGFKVTKLLVNNLFIVIGVLGLGWYWLRRRFAAGEYVWLGLAGFTLLLALLLLPDALQEYNLERLYFQLLIAWAFAGVAGGLLLLRFIPRLRLKYGLLAGIYVLQLLFYSGFIFHFSGGPSLMSLHNYGEEYAKFYTHDSEVAGAVWLGQHYNKELIYTNSPGRNKLRAYGNLDHTKIINETLPSIISRDGFVFETYISTVGGKGLYLHADEERPYAYPRQFLDDNKNLIYSAGKARIYK
jgi:uncharacterized membrane protein